MKPEEKSAVERLTLEKLAKLHGKEIKVHHHRDKKHGHKKRHAGTGLGCQPEGVSHRSDA